MSSLGRLAGRLRSGGGLLAEAVVPPPPGADGRLGDSAAAGPRAAADPGRYALLVEAIREGHELHYGHPRVVRTDDQDLALLAGDQLYAFGLAELAELGDLDAVRVLAEVISRCAQAHAAGDPQRAERVWAAGAAAVGDGARADWRPPV